MNTLELPTKDIKIVSVSVKPDAPIRKNWMNRFAQTIVFTAEDGRELESYVTAERKKNLPRVFGFMLERVNKGVVTVSLDGTGRVESTCYPLF